MSTTTQARTTKAKASTTKKDAAATARSASKTAQSAARKARREADRTERGIRTHSRRVLQAAQAEASAVAAQPTRPLYFTLGVVDRASSGVRTLPASLTDRVVSAPARTRGRIVEVFATAGDLAEKAQQRYTDVARDGEKLVRAVRRQESTQQAVRYAERAQTRASRSVQDAEKAIEAGAEAASEALSKLG